MSAQDTFLRFYKANDLKGFILFWRRLNPGKFGAVQAWINMEIRDGAYDIDEADDP